MFKKQLDLKTFSTYMIRNTSNVNKIEIEKFLSGLLLMTLFTIIWVAIAEAAFKGKDYWVTSLVFGIIIISFIFYYIKFYRLGKSIPEQAMLKVDKSEKLKGKWFGIIFGIEGIAIFLTHNILLNIRHYNLFFPCVAMIVGLHFFPLGKIFSRRFDFVMGVWTCFIALIGFILTYQPVPVYLSTAVIGIGCAIATVTYGIKMIATGNNLIKAA